MSVKKKLLILLGLLILSALFIQNDPVKNHLRAWNVQIIQSGFKLTNFTKEQSKTAKTELLESQNGQVIERITKTEVENHQKFIDDRKFSLESLFLPTTSPYPEVITNILVCPDKFKPKIEISDEKKTIYSLFAGERFNYGICTQDLVKYESLYGIFDCSQKGIFEIEFFGNNIKNMEEIIKTFSC